MAIGDGVRRNAATITQAERDRLLAAFLKLDTTKFFPDGVAYWDKQEEIHKSGHAGGSDVHSGPAFIPWHRELVNRLEGLLREVDPDLSLHYWDWTTDPSPLFTPTFMGGEGDPAGAPFQAFESTEPGHATIWRAVQAGAPAVASDNTIIHASDGQPQANQFHAFNAALQSAHNTAHGHIGGSIGDAHFSFHDPFVFLLHSNLDRLFAIWQTQPGQTWRLDPNQVYGADAASSSLLDNVEPWAGGQGLRPWAPPENQQVVKTYKDLSIIAPPCYDALPSVFAVIEVENPSGIINFNDVPEGETTARAAVFHVYACGDATLEVSTPPGAPYSVISPPSGSLTLHRRPRPYEEARFWIGFTGTTAGAVAPTGSVTIRCVENNQTFTFTLRGNTIARPTVAVMLALDQSGSMDDPAGTSGARRIQVLREAASHFVDVIQPNNGVGLVRFDSDAYPVTGGPFPGLAVTKIGNGGLFDPNRVQARNAVLSHATNLAGATSVGDGVQAARDALAPVAGYDQKAIIVFTDGRENRPASIASVMGAIDSRTFAIGLGSETQVNTAALKALTNGTGGYLLLTGLLTASTDDYFRLTKYFLQILAGVTNTSIVLDPSGFIAPGDKLRLPFVLTEADIDTTVILLHDIPAVRMRLETPHGNLIDPGVVSGFGGTFASGETLSYYRFALPVPLGAGEHGGVWHALLEVDPDLFKKYLSRLDNDPVRLRRARAHGVRYSLNVHAFSNIRLGAWLEQDSLEPGATLTLRATLTEYGIPVDRRASVRAHLERPDGSKTTLSLAEVEPGVFEAATRASQPGLYRARVVASGYSLRGLPFTREHLLTGAVFQGGDTPVTPGDLDGGHEHLCDLIECLLSERGVAQFLKERGIDLSAVLKCLERYCRKGLRAEITATNAGARLIEAGGNLAQMTADPELRRALEVLRRAFCQPGS
jgi:hypothetical protein